MLKITRSPNKLASNRNKSSRSASNKNDNNRSTFGRNNGNGKVNRSGFNGNSIEYAKKLGKSKG